MKIEPVEKDLTRPTNLPLGQSRKEKSLLDFLTVVCYNSNIGISFSFKSPKIRGLLSLFLRCATTYIFDPRIVDFTLLSNFPLEAQGRIQSNDRSRFFNYLRV